MAEEYGEICEIKGVMKDEEEARKKKKKKSLKLKRDYLKKIKSKK